MYQDKIGSSQCKQCLPGTYEDGTGSSLCKQCPPGAYQDETGSSQCKQCPPGTYQPYHAQTSAGEIPNNFIYARSYVFRALLRHLKPLYGVLIVQ